MKIQTIPFTRSVDWDPSYCTALSVDLSQVRKLLWVSGMLSFDEKGQFIGKGNIEAQTEQILKNIEAVLEKMGGSLKNVVQVMVFVKEMKSLRDIHEIRRKFFKEPYPTSTLVEVAGFVNPDALIEINTVAAL